MDAPPTCSGVAGLLVFCLVCRPKRAIPVSSAMHVLRRLWLCRVSVMKVANTEINQIGLLR